MRVYELDDERPISTPASRQYAQLLRNHPDCRDPDHPGCERCEPEAFGVEDEEQ